MKGGVAFLAAVVFVACAACVHGLVPGWALALASLAGIVLTIWFDPTGGATDYADEEEAA